jgi:hypothetical protein
LKRETHEEREKKSEGGWEGEEEGNQRRVKTIRKWGGKGRRRETGQ